MSDMQSVSIVKQFSRFTSVIKINVYNVKGLSRRRHRPFIAYYKYFCGTYNY